MYPATFSDVIMEFNHHVWARGLQQILKGSYCEKIFRFDTVTMTAENICMRIRIDIEKDSKSVRFLSSEENVTVYTEDGIPLEEEDAMEVIMALVEEWKKISLPEFTKHIELINKE